MTGRCFCGRVRYEVSGRPFHSTVCHCADCRRAAGAPFVAWFTVRRAELAFVEGRAKTFASSEGATRGFCADCGTPLTYARDDLPDEIDVTTASLDEPEQVPPDDETFASSRLGWIARLGRLPSFTKARET